MHKIARSLSLEGEDSGTGVTFQNDEVTGYCIHMISPSAGAYNGGKKLRTRLLACLYRCRAKYVIVTSFYLFDTVSTRCDRMVSSLIEGDLGPASIMHYAI